MQVKRDTFLKRDKSKICLTLKQKGDQFAQSIEMGYRYQHPWVLTSTHAAAGRVFVVWPACDSAFSLNVVFSCLVKPALLSGAFRGRPPGPTSRMFFASPGVCAADRRVTPRLLPSLPVPLLLFLSPGAHHTPEDQEPLRVPVAAVTKDHKRRGLNWQKCVLLQLWRSESKLGLARLESRAAPFWGPQGRLCRFAGMAGVFASPSDSYIEILSPDVTALGGGDNGR